jgi:general secretion pathway protein G
MQRTSMLAACLMIATLAACHRDSDAALEGAAEIRANAAVARALNGTCPSLDDLKKSDDKIKTVDPWGSRFVIHCDVSKVWVVSFGPDKKEGTADDIVDDNTVH